MAETIADIIAEKRALADRMEHEMAVAKECKEPIAHRTAQAIIDGTRREADRLEAAHKREAAFHAMTCEANDRLREHLRIALDANGREHGDAAKLREALKLCLRGMCGYCRMDAEARGMTTECVNGCEALLMAKAALAAPPRNCDKVKTSWDVLKKWHEGLDTANDIVRMLDWLLAPATEKEGGAK